MSQPFRVVRSYLRLPPRPGGMEGHIAALSRHQRALGVDVLNAYHEGEADGASVRALAGVPLRLVRPASLRNALFYAGLCTKWRALRGDRPTVLHVHGDWSDFAAGRPLAAMIGADATAATIHSAARPGRDILHRASLHRYDLVFATGRREADHLTRLLGRPVHHLPSAPHPAFLADTPPATPCAYDVVGVSRMVGYKEPHLFLACARLRPGLRFALIGDGPLLSALRDRAAREGIANIALPGAKPREAVRDALRGARLFLHTSREDGAPTAVLEAMACGLPVVLTPSNDYRWLIGEGRNGVVTRGWDAAEIVAAVDALLADEARRMRIADDNRRLAADHGWDAVARRVTALMAECLAGAAR